ncbi:hypothetical protein KCTCHS21_10530 [Cohnella abietis]|uniref:Transcription regulator PadR C-terminal domain-containing protein n=1 Tax=Cohnella abietis TaxID=2507935 RepID=A0A3T1D0N9_9BACL|nr:hypothetical protein KCTCHS21_10530 [Cohnella abietis]
MTFELIAQTDKPDKKVYSITEKGIDSLREWLAEPSAIPVMRDEINLKAYCISTVDPEISRKLFDDRLDYYQTRLLHFQEKISLIQSKCGISDGEAPPYHSPLFGSYILLKKGVMSYRTNIEWCEWVLSILPEENKK